MIQVVYAYYRNHFEELPFDKKLHFASRMALWSGDTFSKDVLEQLRPIVTAGNNPAASLKNEYENSLRIVTSGSKNAAAIRAPYFEKYPLLRSLTLVMFRVNFLRNIYGLDARQALFDFFPREEIETMMQRLLADEMALALLSTHAVNTLYLYNRVILQDDSSPNPSTFLGLGSSLYDLQNPVELQLYIYLYTHCIIGETKFYARPIPGNYRAVYLQMLRELEACIRERFTQVNMDNKFEFLVCCRMLGYMSDLQKPIFDEAEISMSPEGDFIIDQHNSNPQYIYASFAKSEHRNVLYLMATADSAPLLQAL